MYVKAVGFGYRTRTRKTETKNRREVSYREGPQPGGIESTGFPDPAGLWSGQFGEPCGGSASA